MRSKLALAAIASLFAFGAMPAGASATVKLTYRGGAVMPAYRTVEVVWAHGGTAPESEISGGLGEFLGDIAAASGTASAQNVFAMLPEYSISGQAAAYKSSFLGKVQIEPTTGAQVEPSAIEAALNAEIRSGRLPTPVATAGGTPETLYVLVLAPNMSACTEPGACGGPSVVSPTFCSFHDSAGYEGTKYTYTVLPDLSGHMAGGCGESPSQLNNETSNASHQITEAVTDPLVEENDLGWYDDSNGEVADICDGALQETTNVIAGRTWTVQKVWSNVDNNCVGGTSIFAPPTANFVAAPAQNSATFQGTAESANHTGAIAAGIVSYSWDFGDGQSGGGQSATHAYAAAGAYTVTMTATDTLGFTARVTHQVTVSAPPTQGGGSGTGGSTTGRGSTTFAGYEIRPGGTGQATVSFTGSATTTSTGGSVAVASGETVLCPGEGGLCVVTLEATTESGHAARKHKPRRHPIVVGSATLTVSPGATAKLAFKLNTTGKRLLVSHGHLLVKLTVTVRHGSDAPVVSTHMLQISAPKRRRHK